MCPHSLASLAQNDLNTYLLNEALASLTVVKVGREGLNFGTKREISCADLREHSRVRKEGIAQSIPEPALQSITKVQKHHTLIQR